MTDHGIEVGRTFDRRRWSATRLSLKAETASILHGTGRNYCRVVGRKATGTQTSSDALVGRPSLTIRTEFYKPEKGRFLHPEAHRPITVREAACLMSFPRAQARPPRGFILPEDLPMTAVAKGLGNAVPPKLATAIRGGGELISQRGRSGHLEGLAAAA